MKPNKHKQINKINITIQSSDRLDLLRCLIALLRYKKLLLFYGLCNNCRPLDRACGKCDTSEGRTDKVKGRLALVKLKV